MNRWEHRKEVERSYQEHETGRYRYNGLWLTLPQRRQRFRRLLALYLTQIIATLALVIGMGLVHAGPMLGGVSCAAWRLQKRLGWITLEKDQMDSL